MPWFAPVTAINRVAEPASVKEPGEGTGNGEERPRKIDGVPKLSGHGQVAGSRERIRKHIIKNYRVEGWVKHARTDYPSEKQQNPMKYVQEGNECVPYHNTNTLT